MPVVPTDSAPPGRSIAPGAKTVTSVMTSPFFVMIGAALLLKERVGSKPVILSNAKGTVKSVLEIANFHQLFTMK